MKRAAINALIAFNRADFAVYCYDRKRPGDQYFMLYDKSEHGGWSHIGRASRLAAWQQEDREYAAAPYSTDLRLARRVLLHEISERRAVELRFTLGKLCANESDEAALLISLAWLHDRAGLCIKREQVQPDLDGD